MNARTDLADRLRGALPGFYVVEHYAVPDNLDTLAEPLLILWRGTVKPGPAIAMRTNELVVWLVSNLTDPDIVDDDLDEHLATVLYALDRQPDLGWTEATRDTFQDLFPGYRVTLTFYTHRGDE